MEVRTGMWQLDRVVREIEGLEHNLESLLESSPLPEKADYPAINQFLIQVYQRHWDEENRLLVI